MNMQQHAEKARLASGCALVLALLAWGGRRHSLRRAVAGILCLLATGLASGQTSMTWTGSVSTDWSNPTNWTPQQVPTASDHVTINSGSSIIIPADGAFAIMDWNGGSVYEALTVASNGVLNVSGSADNNLYGPLTNAGTVVKCEESILSGQSQEYTQHGPPEVSPRWFLGTLSTLMRKFPPPRRMFQWKRQFNKCK